MANFHRVCSTVVQLPPFFVLLLPQILYLYGFPRWLSGRESAGDAGSILGSGIPPGGGNGNPLQDSCLENSMTEEPSGLQSMVSQRVRYN